MSEVHRRRVAFLVATCFFMEMLDGTIVVTAVPRIGASLKVSPASAGLLVTSYFVTVAVLIPLGAWMSARFGARRVFLAAIIVFTGASFGCAVSSSLGELVAFRVLQGVGGAMMVPIGRIVVFAEAEKSEIVVLMSYIVWPGLIAPVLAPLLGGVITTYAGWRWIFLINLPLGAIALFFAWRLVVSGAPRRAGPLDRVGVVLTCTGLGALTYAAHLASGGHPSWTAVVPVTVAAVALLVTATLHLLSTSTPLIELRTLTIPTFGVSVSGAAIYWVTLGAIPFLLPLLFQTQFGWSPVKSGAIVLFLFLGNIAIKPATTPLYRRFGFRRILLAATAGLVATTLAIATLGASTPLIVIVTVLALSGVARSVGLTGFSTLGLSEVPEGQMADAVTLSSVVQQLFSGLGVAAGTLALRAGRPLGELLSATGAVMAFRVAFVLLALVAVAATLNVLRLAPHAGAALVGR